MKDYKKLYENALERVKDFTERQNPPMLDKEIIHQIFPELRESEDERIRKEIIELVHFFYGSSTIYEHHVPEANMIAWLEKQGEQDQKHFELKAGHWYICHRAYCCRADHLTVKEGERFMCEKDGVVKGFVIKDPEKYFKEVCAPAPIEDEQKTTDKVGPKFKIGDWITNGEYTWNVTDIKPLDYLLQAQNGDVVDDTISYVDEEFHLWTIQDVKDGDVLANGDVNMVLIFKCFAEPSYRQHIIAHIGLDTSGDIQVTDGYWNLGFNCRKPATKEQCDLLFQKMKEAGYEWDAEKKELKKIEQKSSWSEEDEEMIDFMIEFIESLYWRKDLTKRKDEVLSWLKSIKSNHWKPSEEQMEAIKFCCANFEEYDALKSLYNDLKGLNLC